MSSVALHINDGHRRAITEAVVKNALHEESQVHVDTRAELATDLRLYLIGGPKPLKRLLDLPSGWVPKTDDITVQVPGERYCFQFDGRYISGSRLETWCAYLGSIKTVNLKVPENWTGYGKIAGILTQADHPEVLKRIASAVEDQKDFVTRVNDLHRKTFATLKKFRTLKKLGEGWPEIMPFAEVIVGKPSAPVPMVPVDELNAALGLTAEAA